jgi:hypothetical protein
MVTLTGRLQAGACARRKLYPNGGNGRLKCLLRRGNRNEGGKQPDLQIDLPQNIELAAFAHDAPRLTDQQRRISADVPLI